jgi:hypothetical protein
MPDMILTVVGSDNGFFHPASLQNIVGFARVPAHY